MTPRLAFYGDDFTGSTDVMEVLQWSGIPTVLFLEPPDPARLQEFSQFSAFGVAGSSRGMSPQTMQEQLKPVLRQLRDSGAPLVHYKICSTFDSSREIGNIGRAIEIGREVFDAQLVPLLVGAPNLGRYQVFGNLFARSGLDSEPFRLDRHPTMTQHPVTPMNEADIRRHLRAQADLNIELLDVLQLEQLSSDRPAEPVEADVWLFDILYEHQLPSIGRVLQELVTEHAPRFVVGSSGVEYALTRYWNSHDEAAPRTVGAGEVPSFGATPQLLAVTGSCSPVNARQIDWAEQNGFKALALRPERLLDATAAHWEMESALTRTVQTLRDGHNVILHSCRGPQDPRIQQVAGVLAAQGLSETDIRLHCGQLLGTRIGQILRSVLDMYPLPRVAVAGGDTSGYIARELELIALEAIAPLAPGSPLCRAHARHKLDGVEFCFKGGQVGWDDVWGTMLHGTDFHTERSEHERAT